MVKKQNNIIVKVVDEQKNDWCWVYADELPKLFEHFNIHILNRNCRLKLELIDYESGKE